MVQDAYEPKRGWTTTKQRALLLSLYLDCRLLFTYYGKLFACCLSEGFGPLDFSWISFHLEVLMAFRTAKSKDLKMECSNAVRYIREKTDNKRSCETKKLVEW